MNDPGAKTAVINKLSSWKSATLDYLGELVLTTVSTITPLAVGFVLISYIHKHYNSEGDGISRENKTKITAILKKFSLSPKDLKLDEHEWTIALNLSDPDSLEGLSWTDIAGCGKEVQILKNLVLLPIKSSVDDLKPLSPLSDTLLRSPKGELIKNRCVGKVKE